MSHYFTDDDLTETFPITVRARGTSLTVLSGKGVFSKDQLDRGTHLLLEVAHLPATGRVLDLGCGIGVVGLFVKTWLSTVEVVQTDVTDKAVELAKKNAGALRLKTRVVKSDCYEALQGERFDAILVNPPRAAGKVVIERMISEAPDHLNPGGSLQLVALTNKGGKSYEGMLKDAFGNVEKIGRGSGYSVYKSVLR